ncbi:hypothetical protein CEXT_406201 [Caerostris extrusa]|uniref:Uncharacterized protein n=1 Tax=Caerostris extrusa TaxID=172846 RepID=A0AAV4MGB3_CAEEX|nr:hypothetical protein CEXT_406201 [Caerostris extrusa]
MAAVSPNYQLGAPNEGGSVDDGLQMRGRIAKINYSTLFDIPRNGDRRAVNGAGQLLERLSERMPSVISWWFLQECLKRYRCPLRGTSC